jgi:hypothetical protein
MRCRIMDQAPETTVERIRIVVQVELEEYPEQVLDKQIDCLWGVLPVDERFVDVYED